MPCCGATFDENEAPLGQEGTSGGFREGETNPPRRCATAVAPRPREVFSRLHLRATPPQEGFSGEA